ncbi:hypothetical protein HanRHA438_Chr04g0183631 [Helianthus annuus]|nr:hypothetical protein HanIR_Chr04g0187551 [Helianthus annuus]KAJ0927503.1 hypothetical protein HanRHA438_Chr04g0183631 [Helianthus annuus]
MICLCIIYVLFLFDSMSESISDFTLLNLCSSSFKVFSFNLKPIYMYCCIFNHFIYRLNDLYV